MNRDRDFVSFPEFLKTMRIVIVIVLIAWCFLSVARLMKLEPTRDPFTNPTPPFQAVITKGPQMQRQSSLSSFAQGAWQDVTQMILYSPK